MTMHTKKPKKPTPKKARVRGEEVEGFIAIIRIPGRIIRITNDNGEQEFAVKRSKLRHYKKLSPLVEIVPAQLTYKLPVKRKR